MSEYRVLARKYRPTNFDDLIGQEVLVRTLSNAITQNRLAHAFLLTGIRGIGKTTTARIIAKALNCIGPTGQGGPTIQPCGECANCVAIAQDRHVDVMEMDAASRTGVDDIRDIIETVHYAPTNARYKIYIIDEVHMLSKNAFNALLKTLEEPPPHVKFIFATTELRKIPVTILSRCQRFDLKRIDRDMLAQHLANICAKESVTADAESLAQIATAAEGSVRDALSLLDQAIAHAGEGDANHIKAQATAAMLGLADKTRNYALLDKLYRSQPSEALTLLREQYAAGSDPVQILQELLEIVHLLTLAKSGTGSAAATSEQQVQLSQMAESLSLTLLTRSWQMLLKGLQECQLAPNPLMAAEMVLIRIAHLSELPSPEEIIRKLKNEPALVAKSAPSPTPVNVSPRGPASGSMVQSAAAPMMTPQELPATTLAHFNDVLALFEQKKELILYHHLDRDASLVQFRQGHLELNFSESVPQDVPGRIAKKLTEWTGQRWLVSLSKTQGEASRYNQRLEVEKKQLEAARQNPLVQEVLLAFPDANLIRIEKGASDEHTEDA